MNRMKKQTNRIGVVLRCTVCAVSIDVEFASTPVSPLVPRRHLVTWAIPLVSGGLTI